jgi:hypothetical protein
MKRWIATACLGLLAIPAWAQTPRNKVELACTPTESTLVYRCLVQVADPAGKPVEGAEVTLSADMPSMPMAHNVKPVTARPITGKPGSYEATLELEMPGEWLVKLQFRAPHRDLVTRKLDFQQDMVTPARTR